MRPDFFLIGLVTFSVMILTGTLIIGDINQKYTLDIGSDEKFAETYTAINDTINQTNVISQDIRNKSLGGETSATDTVDTVVRGSFSAVRLVGNSFELVRSIVNGIANAIGVPTFFITFLMTIMVLSVIFAIIFIFMRVAT